MVSSEILKTPVGGTVAVGMSTLGKTETNGACSPFASKVAGLILSIE